MTSFLTVLSETGATLRQPVALRAAVLSLMFLIVTGPFGTFSDMGLGERIVYWTPVFLISAVMGAGVCVWTRLRFTQLSHLVRRCVATTIFIATFSPILYIYNLGFTAPEEDIPMSMLVVVALVSAISLACIGAVTLLEDETSEQGKDVVEARLLARLSDLDGASVCHLTVDDHYVIVSLTDGRQQRLLMRLSDAIGEMDQVAGFVTHRSHWVAKAYIEDVVRVDGREFVALTSGGRVPVSRRYRENVIRAGVKVPA